MIKLDNIISREEIQIDQANVRGEGTWMPVAVFHSFLFMAAAWFKF